MDDPFPGFLTRLPEAVISAPGGRGWILQSQDQQVAFLQFEAGTGAAPHSHGEQWGIVIDGLMELMIEGRVSLHGPGAEHHIPAGVVHGARFLSRTRMINVFGESDRYDTKPGANG